jgi:transcriptional regulator with XRE-family HTH domain
MCGFNRSAALSLNGNLNGHQDPEEPKQNTPGPNNPGNSEASPTPESAPVQLAFSFALTPQPDGGKTPWLKRVQQAGLSCYWEIYQNLLDSPPDWETKFWLDHPARKREWPKKALYIAWAAAPSNARQPRTQNEFAEAIGVSTQAIWKWKNNNPEMTELINELALFPLEAAIRDVDFVTLKQATALDSPVPARKLFYDRYEAMRAARLPVNPAQLVQVYQKVINNINWDQLTDEQTGRIIAGEDPFLVVVSGAVPMAAEAPMARTTEAR